MGIRILMGALCGSEVDKMVDENVPLTMNYRGVNISKHKELGHYRCLPRAMTGGPGHHFSMNYQRKSLLNLKFLLLESATDRKMAWSFYLE